MKNAKNVGALLAAIVVSVNAKSRNGQSGLPSSGRLLKPQRKDRMMSEQELKDCPNCEIPLGRDGGCHYPYCCAPHKPEPATGEVTQADILRVARLNFSLTDEMHKELLDAFAAHRLSAEARQRERDAGIADRHAESAWDIAKREGQNVACASGRNYGARVIAQAIREGSGHQ